MILCPFIIDYLFHYLHKACYKRIIQGIKASDGLFTAYFER
ncbi:hypothetical protein SLEP1_g57345 [Rubroshorea leprosula]|uniref:Uncharacterized protein n=1 Tax=Rubroshorea leprosula TaxID=152421 RepID=A0AAV5MM74_9ROSI|nr:hypothetical protein SLEP1_g57345 [Rubroshorea leprosula]